MAANRTQTNIEDGTNRKETASPKRRRRRRGKKRAPNHQQKPQTPHNLPKKAKSLADLMEESGLTGLSNEHSKENPPPNADVEECLRTLRRLLNGSDELRLDTVRREAIRLLKNSGIQHPESSVKAALELDSPNKTVEAANIEKLLTMAAPVLECGDPVDYIEKAIRDSGYGGDVTPALLTYICITSRVLQYKRGQAPAHLMLLGEASIGKSFALHAVLLQMPKEAIYKIDAGSPRALIYDEQPIKHKAVVFSERDSLPKARGDDDDTAASAIRNLLQEGHLDYLTVPKSSSGAPKTVHIEREGPSVLITTGIEGITGQLGSRLFTFNMKEDLEQISDALKAAADTEMTDDESELKPDEALVSYQIYLQRKAPWKVKVVFAHGLRKCLERRIQTSRVLRDFDRLRTMVKSVTLIRHSKRQVDRRGSLLAELEDYETVRKLASSMYESTSSGMSSQLKKLVTFVAEQLKQLGRDELTSSSSEIANALTWTRDIAKKQIRNAIQKGYLKDCRDSSSSYDKQKYVLALGPEPLPDSYRLPTVAEIEAEMEKLQQQAGTAGTALVQKIVPVESNENKGDREYWDSGTNILDTSKGGKIAKGITTPPLYVESKSRSHVPRKTQTFRDENLNLGPPKDPSRTQGSQKKPWWPASLTYEEISELFRCSPGPSKFSHIEDELLRRSKPTPPEITPIQKTRLIHCLAVWSVLKDDAWILVEPLPKMSA